MPNAFCKIRTTNPEPSQGQINNTLNSNFTLIESNEGAGSVGLDNSGNIPPDIETVQEALEELFDNKNVIYITPDDNNYNISNTEGIVLCDTSMGTWPGDMAIFIHQGSDGDRKVIKNLSSSLHNNTVYVNTTGNDLIDTGTNSDPDTYVAVENGDSISLVYNVETTTWWII